jgi:flagellar basal-body rod modification protein FlgD
MTDISAGTLGGVIGSSNPNAVSDSTAMQHLDKQTFLDLLVAQMKYQNPLSPADSNEFLAQAAQYASVEQLENMAQTQADMKSMQMITVASGLVGKEITAISELTGEPIVGLVETVRFGEEPILVIDGAEIMLSEVRQIESAPDSGVPIGVPPAVTQPSAAPQPVAEPTAPTEPSPTGQTDSTPTDPAPIATATAQAAAGNAAPTQIADPLVVAAPEPPPADPTPAAVEQSLAAYQANQILG